MKSVRSWETTPPSFRKSESHLGRNPPFKIVDDKKIHSDKFLPICSEQNKTELTYGAKRKNFIFSFCLAPFFAERPESSDVTCYFVNRAFFSSAPAFLLLVVPGLNSMSLPSPAYVLKTRLKVELSVRLCSNFQ